MSQLPQIEFVYSALYDQVLSNLLGGDFDRKKALQAYASFFKRLVKHWTREKEKSALTRIKECTGLSWKGKEIKIYPVTDISQLNGFSHPLTICMNKNTTLFCLFIIHELIHVFHGQNRDGFKTVLSHLKKKYKKENENTIKHIITNAIERRVFSEIYGEKFYLKYLKTLKRFRRNGRAYILVDEIYLKLQKNILKSLRAL